MTWQKALIRLQEIDSEFQRINQRLGEIEAHLKDQTEVQSAQRDATATSQTNTNAKQTQSELEFELGKIQGKLQQTETKLYGGSVTNARELQDLQTEFQALQRHIDSLEDELLTAMDLQEKAAEAALKAQEHLNRVQTEWEEQHKHLIQEQEELRGYGNTLLEELQNVKKQIPAAILDAYKYLKERTGGVPVARLEGSVCKQCGMEVSKPTERLANQGKEAYCDGCHRLIVI